jgi:hypothetical protein
MAIFYPPVTNGGKRLNERRQAELASGASPSGGSSRKAGPSPRREKRASHARDFCPRSVPTGKRRHTDQRGEPDPFERLFAFGGLIDPHPNDPDGQERKFVETSTMARWHSSRCVHDTYNVVELALCPCRAGRSNGRTSCTSRRPNLLKERAKRSPLGLSTPILRRTHDKMGNEAAVQELKDSGSTIRHMPPHARCRRGTNVLAQWCQTSVSFSRLRGCARVSPDGEQGCE